MARAVLAAAPVVVVTAVSWAALESPRTPWPFACAAAAALVLAIVPWRPARLLGAVAVLLAIPCLVLRAWPVEAARALREGVDEAVSVSAPFDPAAATGLHALVVLGSFGVAAAVCLAVAERRPLLAAAAAIVGVAWPATLLAERPIAHGTVALACALWLPFVLRTRSVRLAPAALAVFAGLAVAAGAVASSGVTPDQASVHWRGWNPFAIDGKRVGVQYVWDASYGGIDFPPKATVVLRIRAPRRSLYWRASTLDLFADDRWIESLYPVMLAAPRRRLPPDPLLASVARDPDDAVEQTVTVEALRETRLVAAAQPVRVRSARIERVFFLSGGVMIAQRGVPEGTTYTVWSHAPRPTPRELVASPPAYPAEALRYLDVGRARAPAFGVAGRASVVDALFGDPLYLSLAPYRPLWERARSLAAGAGSPYEAVVAVERWLRRDGGFRYEEHPPRAKGVPPLVDFVTRTRQGYCQHYAGTMALMLRLLGIPARVAVGFTSGRRSGETWVVTDHQAHVWVEAWFAGHGWLTFDPTPDRGTLSLAYTLASDSADAVRALGTGRFLDYDAAPPDVEPAPVAAAEPASTSRQWPPWLLAMIAVPLALVGAIPLAKSLRRRRRLGRHDPRAAASGMRSELADRLLDHGLAIDRSASAATLGRMLERAFGVAPGALVDALATARYGPPERSAQAAAAGRRELGLALRGVSRRVGRLGAARAAFGVRSLRRGA